MLCRTFCFGPFLGLRTLALALALVVVPNYSLLPYSVGPPNMSVPQCTTNTRGNLPRDGAQQLCYAPPKCLQRLLCMRRITPVPPCNLTIWVTLADQCLTYIRVQEGPWRGWLASRRQLEPLHGRPAAMGRATSSSLGVLVRKGCAWGPFGEQGRGSPADTNCQAPRHCSPPCKTHRRREQPPWPRCPLRPPKNGLGPGVFLGGWVGEWKGVQNEESVLEGRVEWIGG